MNSKLPPDDLDNPISDADERALDALLGETLKLNPPPPDLAPAILKSLSAQWEAASRSQSNDGKISLKKNVSVARRNGIESQSLRPHRRLRRVMISLTVALAATVLFVVSKLDFAKEQNVAHNQAQPDLSAVAAVKPSTKATQGVSDAARPSSDLASNQPMSTSDSPKETAPAVTPREGVPLVRRESMTPEASTSEPASTPQPSAIVSANDVKVDLRSALTKFDAAMTDYWKRVGVEPALPIDDTQLASRVNARYGTHFTAASGESLVESVLTTKEECRDFSTKLIASLFRSAPLADESRERMIEESTAAILTGQPFDRLISRWITDKSLFVPSQPEQLARSVATNLLDIDAACAKCHDSPIDGRFAQHDYWSFASIFAPSDRPVLFYELPDGRQKASEPHLPTRWLGTPSAIEPEVPATPSPDEFAKALLNNTTLASAIANRVWEIGFDAPLVSRSSSLVSPPRDEALLKAHQELADVLVKSNFDMRQLARVIISSSAMKRSTNELFEEDRWVVANEQALAAAVFAQRTFAASGPSRPRLNRDQLLAAIESRLGGAPRAIDSSKTLLAQPGLENNGAGQGIQSEKASPEDFAWATWVADRGALKDSWLHWIDDATERERHAFYVNGHMGAINASDLSKRLLSPSDDANVAKDNAIDRLAWLLSQGR